jgi:hypothetical protein
MSTAADVATDVTLSHTLPPNNGALVSALPTAPGGDRSNTGATGTAATGAGAGTGDRAAGGNSLKNAFSSALALTKWGSDALPVLPRGATPLAAPPPVPLLLPPDLGLALVLVPGTVTGASVCCGGGIGGEGAGPRRGVAGLGTEPLLLPLLLLPTPKPPAPRLPSPPVLAGTGGGGGGAGGGTCRTTEAASSTLAPLTRPLDSNAEADPAEADDTDDSASDGAAATDDDPTAEGAADADRAPAGGAAAVGASGAPLL